MSSGATGLEVLSRAESELRALIEAALAGGRYEDVAALARLADGVMGLRSGELDGGALAAATRNADRAPRRSLPPSPGASDGSPRYERDGEKLIKIAESGKPGQPEYEHRASFDVVETLLATIKSKKGVGARFTVPDIFPLKDPKTRRSIPSYKSYLVLGWLRQEGVLIKHGRDAYSLKPTAEAPEQIRKLWNALPSRDQ